MTGVLTAPPPLCQGTTETDRRLIGRQGHVISLLPRFLLAKWKMPACQNEDSIFENTGKHVNGPKYCTGMTISY